MPGTIVVFLDHNPAAFAVLVDWMRYGEWFVPPSVDRKLVDVLAWELLKVHVPIAEVMGGVTATSAQLACPSNTKLDRETSASSRSPSPNPSTVSAPAPSDPPSYSEVAPREASTTESSPLHVLLTVHLLPLVTAHRSRGHSSLNLILGSSQILRSSIVTSEFVHSHTPFEIVHVPDDFDLPTDDEGLPTLQCLMQENVQKDVAREVQRMTGGGRTLALCTVEELTLRTCNDMGLYESSRLEAVVVRVTGMSVE
ncbi:hypothetical protein HKX48_009226 [Thoreauomyces humboldtii]|nr:hypothetical protein HKX48_009226 [Thoreauomyces humboldtii]